MRQSFKIKKWTKEGSRNSPRRYRRELGRAPNRQAEKYVLDVARVRAQMARHPVPKNC